METFRFHDPWVLLLIPAVWVLTYWSGRRHAPAVMIGRLIHRATTLRPEQPLKEGWRWAKALAMCLILIALARPQKVMSEISVQTEGIDIVLALDISGSMAAEDFKIDNKRVNRLEVVKRVAEDFIRARRNDRLGLVAFAATAYPVSPLTTDHEWLIRHLKRVRLGLIADGTAIGDGLMTSVHLLEDSPSATKVVILMTDGVNNSGLIHPLKAASVAQAMGVRVYTIGVGSRGWAPIPQADFFGRTIYVRQPVQIDEALLQKIAAQTGGQYFRATDTASLKKIYDTIDRLEKSKIEQTGYVSYSEEFTKWLMAGLLLWGFSLIWQMGPAFHHPA